MSDAESKTVISEGDQKFILCCLGHVIGDSGTIPIDIAAVAADLGYGNPKSAANKLAKIRKDYGLPIVPGKAAISSAGKTPAQALVPAQAKTTAKAKVEKKLVPSKRAAPPPEDEDEDSETHTVVIPSHKPRMTADLASKKPKVAKEPEVKAPAKAKVTKTPTTKTPKVKAPPKGKKVAAASLAKVASEGDDADLSGDASTHKKVDSKDGDVSQEIKSQLDASQQETVDDDDDA